MSPKYLLDTNIIIALFAKEVVIQENLAQPDKELPNTTNLLISINLLKTLVSPFLNLLSLICISNYSRGIKW